MNMFIAASDDIYDQRLAAARHEAEKLGWDVIETLGGFVAVPRGTEIIATSTVTALLVRLRAHHPVTS